MYFSKEDEFFSNKAQRQKTDYLGGCWKRFLFITPKQSVEVRTSNWAALCLHVISRYDRRHFINILIYLYIYIQYIASGDSFTVAYYIVISIKKPFETIFRFARFIANNTFHGLAFTFIPHYIVNIGQYDVSNENFMFCHRRSLWFNSVNGL